MSEKNRRCETITYMSFDDYEDMRDHMIERSRRRAEKDRKKRAAYYKQQRKFGFSIIIVGVICLLITCILPARMVQLFGSAMAIIGLYITVTPQMILVNQYYLERRDRLNEF